MNGNTGAGVYAVAEIDLRSSTLTGNRGGGLFFAGTFRGYKAARIANSVLAGNAGSDWAQPSAALTVLTVTYSHFDTASGNCDLSGNGNVVDPGATMIDRGDVTATISVTVTPAAVVPAPVPARPKPPVVSRLAAARHGWALRFTLSAPAKVTIRLIRGKTRKTITAKGRTGTNTVKLKLKRGRYRVTVTAASAAPASKTLTLG